MRWPLFKAGSLFPANAIGVDLGKMNTVGDLQGGIEEAERLLGFKVVRTDDAAR